MTLDEVADYISAGLPRYQRNANREWLDKVYGTVSMGGAWVYLAAELMFIKTEEGFDLEEDILDP
jgi:hypothetical protein